MTEEAKPGGRLPLRNPNTLNPEQKTLYNQINQTMIPSASKAGFEGKTEKGTSNRPSTKPVSPTWDTVDLIPSAKRGRRSAAGRQDRKGQGIVEKGKDIVTHMTILKSQERTAAGRGRYPHLGTLPSSADGARKRQD